MGQNLIAAFGVSLTLTWHTTALDITRLTIYNINMKWLTHLPLMHGVIVTLALLFVFCVSLSLIIEYRDFLALMLTHSVL